MVSAAPFDARSPGGGRAARAWARGCHLGWSRGACGTREPSGAVYSLSPSPSTRKACSAARRGSMSSSACAACPGPRRSPQSMHRPGQSGSHSGAIGSFERDRLGGQRRRGRARGGRSGGRPRAPASRSSARPERDVDGRQRPPRGSRPCIGDLDVAQAARARRRRSPSSSSASTRTPGSCARRATRPSIGSVRRRSSGSGIVAPWIS